MSCIRNLFFFKYDLHVDALVPLGFGYTKRLDLIRFGDISEKKVWKFGRFVGQTGEISTSERQRAEEQSWVLESPVFSSCRSSQTLLFWTEVVWSVFKKLRSVKNLEKKYALFLRSYGASTATLAAVQRRARRFFAPLRTLSKWPKCEIF